MQKFALALTFSLAAAENLLDIEQPHRQLASTAPNSSVTTEADCNALSSIPSYYNYVWNTSGCYCEHQWAVTYAWNTCGMGEVRNPFHEPGNYADICITDAAYAALDLTRCPPTPPTPPTCEQLIGEEPGYASAYLKRRSIADDGASVTGYETGFVIFEEMCGGTCGDSSCDGTCVSGNFWGLFFHSGLADDNNEQMQDLFIKEFASPADPETNATGCVQAGTIFNPEGISSIGVWPTDDATVPTGGHLKAVLSLPDDDGGQCGASPYAFCSPPGKIKFTGEDSIIGRSVTLRKNSNINGQAHNAEKPAMACGTIGTDIFNPDMNVRTSDAKDSSGSACPSGSSD